MSRRLARIALAALVACGVGAAVRAEEPPGAAIAPPPFAPFDLPDWRIVEDPARLASEPWLVVIDDPQCPYCMLLHLGIVKARAAGDPELTRAVVVRVPFPLYTHDQSVHIVMDAFCLEATRSGHPWSASAYLDWLLEGSWMSDPGWASASVADFDKAGGFFEANYEAHEVTSSRRREYQTPFAEAESACTAPPGPGFPSSSCHGDAGCAALCDKQLACRAACESEVAAAGGACGECSANPEGTPANAANVTPVTGEPSAQPLAACLADCKERFVHSRWAQFSKAHSACLLESGPDSAQAKTAAAIAWATAHQVQGTPTLYVGHPRIGFRQPPDADSFAGWFAAIDKELAAVRARLAAQP